MKHRLYLPTLAGRNPAAETRSELTAEQSHYLTRVLRLDDGAEIAVFDGQGSEWLARLRREARRSHSVEIQRLLRQTEAPSPLILIQSWLKGAAMDTVTQKATELGITGLWLISSGRSNVRVDTKRLGNKLAHLQRVAGSAAEQSNSLWVPELRHCPDLAAALTSACLVGQVVFLDLNAPGLTVSGDPQPLSLVVGPEGGWTEAERSLAESTASVSVAGLGELTLRAETAPLAALAAVRHGWGWRR